MPCHTIHLSHGITIQVGLIDPPKFPLQLSIYYPYTSVLVVALLDFSDGRDVRRETETCFGFTEKSKGTFCSNYKAPIFEFMCSIFLSSYYYSQVC